jgi:hypothetical protein
MCKLLGEKDDANDLIQEADKTNEWLWFNKFIYNLISTSTCVIYLRLILQKRHN